jgi:hypothetical protein
LDHLDDVAECYALGLVNEAESDAIEAHVRWCRACSDRLGRAEATVAALVERTLGREPAPPELVARISTFERFGREPARKRRSWPMIDAWAAVAILAIVSVSLLLQTIGLRSSLSSDSTLLVALVRGHFSHAQFVSPNGDPLAAKVVYERHGRWYEIIATGIDADARVTIVRAGVATESPARFALRGDAIMLALPALGQVDELRLVDSHGRLLGRVRPVLGPGSR